MYISQCEQSGRVVTFYNCHQKVPGLNADRDIALCIYAILALFLTIKLIIFFACINLITYWPKRFGMFMCIKNSYDKYLIFIYKLLEVVTV